MIYLSGLKENKFVQGLINELSNYLENNLKLKNEEVPIIEDIISKNNLTTGNENAIRGKLEDVILEYAQQNYSNNTMYFIKDKSSLKNEAYTVLKVDNNKTEEMEISKKDLPNNIKINDVFIEENGNYVMDNISAKELQNEIKNMAKEIINKQNINLDKHRKEGHLYMVTEEIGNNRFLWDLTDAPKNEFEEVNIPKDVLDKATEGTVLKYTNGKYEYFADDGFERAEKIK